MTLSAIAQSSKKYETIPDGAFGQWFVATDALAGKSIAELHVTEQTGAIVLATRRGFWTGDRERQDIELFLWGTAEQLADAQERFRLQSWHDALLDRPELYWG